MTPTAPAVRPASAVLPVPQAAPGHPGCYWNPDRAAWVAWTPVPRPRRPRD